MATWNNIATIMPMNNIQWDKYSISPLLCDVKAIVIHGVNYAPNPPVAEQVKKDWERGYYYKQSNEGKPDMSQAQGSYSAFTQFVVSDSQIIMCTPVPNQEAWHVGDSIKEAFARGKKPAGSNTELFPRGKTPGRANHYCIGIEHVHNTNKTELEYGKFSAAVLRNSHKVVRSLFREFPSIRYIFRHYDVTGKACPLWYAPVYGGNIKTAGGEQDIPNWYNDPDYPKDDSSRQRNYKVNAAADDDTQKMQKERRWQALYRYYNQSDESKIPSEIL